MKKIILFISAFLVTTLTFGQTDTSTTKKVAIKPVTENPELKALITEIELDADKFYNKANSAAGTRVRKGMQDLKNIAQAIRAEVQELKNKEPK